MSTCLESRARPDTSLMPRLHVWGCAVIAPLVLAAAWLRLFRWLDELSAQTTPHGSGLEPWSAVVYEPAGMGTLRGLLLVLLLSTATITDLRWRRIYNWTTYTVLGWVVLLQLLILALEGPERAMLGGPRITSSLGMLPWRESLAGFAAGFGIMFVLYNLFRGGAGDLKLVAVLGALVGVNPLIEILIYSYILAGIFAACLVVGVAGPRNMLAFALRGVGIGGTGNGSANVSNCLKRQVPMAPFLAGGTLLALILH